MSIILFALVWTCASVHVKPRGQVLIIIKRFEDSFTCLVFLAFRSNASTPSSSTNSDKPNQKAPGPMGCPRIFYIA
jgi:hypothetical protein